MEQNRIERVSSFLQSLSQDANAHEGFLELNAKVVVPLGARNGICKNDSSRACWTKNRKCTNIGKCRR